jgi:hypothetical protein
MKAIIVVVSMIMVTSLLFGCEQRILLPEYAIENIQSELEYVLAPTYLPPGFKFNPGNVGTESYLIDLENQQIVSLVYSSDTIGHENRLLRLLYPVTFYPEGSSLMREFGLTRPEEAMSVISVNGRDAYLVFGNWDTDTLDEIASATIPTNPQWDYDAAITINFDFDVPAVGSVRVMLRTSSYPGEDYEDWISQKAIIRIAESVVMVD